MGVHRGDHTDSCYFSCTPSGCSGAEPKRLDTFGLGLYGCFMAREEELAVSPNEAQGVTASGLFRLPSLQNILGESHNLDPHLNHVTNSYL